MVKFQLIYLIHECLIEHINGLIQSPKIDVHESITCMNCFCEFPQKTSHFARMISYQTWGRWKGKWALSMFKRLVMKFQLQVDLSYLACTNV